MTYATGTGLAAGGAYLYAVTFYDGSGETMSGPTIAFTAGPTAPSAPATIGTASDWSGDNDGNLDPGADYSYKYTFHSGATGTESAASAASNTYTALDNGDGQADGKLSRTGLETPPSGYEWRFYRTEGGGATYKLMNGASDGFSSDDANFFYDRQSDATGLTSDTAPAAGVNRQQAALSNIPLGPSGTTGRRIYRTVAGGAQLKLVTDIANNTATTYTDSTADGSLGANVPTSNTSGLAAGSGAINSGATSILVTSVAPFSSTGGWVVAAGQGIRYTGYSGSSLTGVPASGTGSLGSTLNYGTEIIVAPTLTGISASGDGAILYTIPKGEDVNLLVTRNDTTAQTAMAGFVGGDGIHEEYVQDRRLSQTEAEERGDAKLTELKDPVVTARYQTRDQTTRAGRQVTITLGAPTSITGTFKIQQVTYTQFDRTLQATTVQGITSWPLRDVTASSRRESFESLLRILKQQAA